MKSERIKEAIRLATEEIEYRLGEQGVDSEHELRTITLILDFGQSGATGVLSRVEMKRRGI